MFDAQGLEALKSDRSEKAERTKQVYVAKLIEMEQQLDNEKDKYKD